MGAPDDFCTQQVCMPLTDDNCTSAGCSGELCLSVTDAMDFVSICLWKCEYECTKLQKCGVNENGVCGWSTSTENEAKYAQCMTGCNVSSDDNDNSTYPSEAYRIALSNICGVLSFVFPVFIHP